MTVSVSVPATASNLGAGFDCIGVAVHRRLHVSVGFASDGPPITIRRAGTLAALDIAPEDDLIVAGFRAACARAGRELPSRLAFSADSDIPVGRGLGSSAAALVAGAMAAAALLDDVVDARRIIALGAEHDGHPDNVAPAVLGGAVLAVSHAGAEPTTARLDVHASLRFAFAIPDFTVDTQRARAALPDSLPHAVARAAAAAAAALVVGLARADGALLTAGLEGPLHVPFRRALVPWYDEVVAAARAAGAFGATLSGSGSSVVAIAPLERADQVAAAMAAAWSARGVAATPFVSEPCALGASSDAIDRNAPPLPGRSSTVEISS